MKIQQKKEKRGLFVPSSPLFILVSLPYHFFILSYNVRPPVKLLQRNFSFHLFIFCFTSLLFSFFLSGYKKENQRESDNDSDDDDKVSGGLI